MWSASLKLVYIIELMVPWESLVEEAFERKRVWYDELAAHVQQQGWRAKVRPVEVGCRGFVAASTSRLLAATFWVRKNGLFLVGLLKQN